MDLALIGPRSGMDVLFKLMYASIFRIRMFDGRREHLST